MAPEALPTISELFTAFLRLGATAFGGPAMVAYIRRLAVDKKGWLDASAFGDGVALCQTLPGATAMQVAAYVGLRLRGVLGAAASFCGFGLPAFIWMMVLAALYKQTRDLPVVVAAFGGLQAAVVGIVANATTAFGAIYLRQWKAILIACIAAVMFWLGLHPVLVILLAAALGALPTPPQSPETTSPRLTAPTSSNTRVVLFIILGAVIALVALWLVNPLWLDLSLLMLRIDVLAFGGGFSSLPVMLHEIVGVRHWITAATFMDGLVLGQITPGPIVITATFVGYLVSGPLGGVVATLSIFLPSFLLVALVWPYFNRLRGNAHFNHAMQGILGSFVGLLFAVTLRLALNVHWEWRQIVIALGALLALRLKIDILWVVLSATIVSLLLFR